MFNHIKLCLGAGASAANAAAGQPAAAAAAEGRLAELAGQFRPLGRHIIVLAFQLSYASTAGCATVPIVHTYCDSCTYSWCTYVNEALLGTFVGHIYNSKVITCDMVLLL